MGDEWYTPKSVFDSLGVVFDLDVCAPPGGPMYVPCRKFYTQEDDSLTQLWNGLVWMNPPYSRPAPFVARWIDHGDGIALLPAAKSKWFVDLSNRPDAKFVFLPSTFKFVTPDGDPISLMMLSTLWAVGDRAIKILGNSGIGALR